MEKVSIELPTMYGDHHVVEVRRILFGIAGVEEVYASSGFQMVEINYDQEQTSPEAIKAALANAGYTGELPAPLETETEIAQGENNGEEAVLPPYRSLRTNQPKRQFCAKCRLRRPPFVAMPGDGTDQAIG